MKSMGNETNPFSHYVYGDDAIRDCFRTVKVGYGKISKKEQEKAAQRRHVNPDWTLWQLRHGKDVCSEDSD